jgi:hypothetical protein
VVGAAVDLFALLLEIPDIEHFAARQYALRLEQLEQRLAEQQRGEPGDALVEHRLPAHDLERRCAAQLVEQEAVEPGGRRDLLRRIEDDVHLVEQRVDVEQEAVEVRQQLGAAGRQRLQRRRIAGQAREGVAIVGVALDPVGALAGH